MASRKDPLLERLTVEPKSTKLQTIDYPEKLAPVAVDPGRKGDQAMPIAAVSLITYTAAEAEAAAAIFTPGVDRKDWIPYTWDWASIEPQLTGRSPAKAAGCSAHYWQSKVGDTLVNVIKSELHLSTDAESLPFLESLEGMAKHAWSKLWLTTGTAGGAGLDTVLGDVCITGTGKFNCTKDFAKQSWAHAAVVSPANAALVTLLGGTTPNLSLAFSELVKANAAKLQEAPAPYTPSRVPTVFHAGNTSLADVETMDYFGFAANGDPYDVEGADPSVRMEEMDDCVFGLASAKIPHGIPWLSVRNASDPQMTAGDLAAMKKAAGSIYSRFGFYTSIGSLLACWGLIADWKF